MGIRIVLVEVFLVSFPPPLPRHHRVVYILDDFEPHHISDQKSREATDTMRTTLHLLLTLSFFQTLVNGRASVMVIPNSSQFFEYENILVSCNSSSSWEWTPWRNDTDLVKCGSGWGKLSVSTCNITTVKLSEGGVFWCQSKYGDSSNGVNISIVGGPVSLQSPAVPVTEGDNVTLICRTKMADPPSADFYKDGVFIGAESDGQMTLYNFTKSNQGAYKCGVQNKGESPESWVIMEG
ncbi:sialoadhesin-like [Notothenia coriiceps]|uniref:Sialoadhesin-like n=1 Tax=Notothenia coriiceps TaxID=8208 RepID=A0A6I9PR13_9TELE|nr:PREDICTED: sialoadhesin-like [Notothenia coriiceps]